MLGKRVQLSNLLAEFFVRRSNHIQLADQASFSRRGTSPVVAQPELKLTLLGFQSVPHALRNV